MPTTPPAPASPDAPAPESKARRWQPATPRQLWRRLPQELRTAIFIGVLAVVAGLVAVAFHASVEHLSKYTFERMLEGTQSLASEGEHHWLPALLKVLVFVVGGSAIATFLIRTIEPSCAGGGVMPVKLAFWKNAGFMRLRTGVVKFLGSAITLGCGVSMGPEGPAAQMGAAVMSSTAGALGVPANKRRAFAAAGAAASLAAVFNAPLTAIAFVLEEIVGNLTSRLVGGIVLAAVIGALVAHALIGPQPAFRVVPLQDASWRGIVLCPFVAVLAAMAGVAFQKGALRVRGRCKNWRLIHPRFQPIVGALGTWVLGGAAFLVTGRMGVFGVGYADVTACIEGQLAWSTAVILGVAKLGATLLAVGTAGCGGIFAPNLFIGAMCGGTVAALAGLAGDVFPLSHSDQAMLVMSGMCACLGAVIRTPTTCILLIFETTHQFVIIPLLLVATVISQLVSRRLCYEGMYESMMRQDGENPHRVLPPTEYSRWRELSCADLMRDTPCVISEAQLEPVALTTFLEQNKFERFPVIASSSASESGDDAPTKTRIIGILSRHEALSALAGQRRPHFSSTTWISPEATLAAAQSMLISAPENMLCIGDLVVDESTRKLQGVLTTHDLLRAQVVMLEDSSD